MNREKLERQLERVLWQDREFESHKALLKKALAEVQFGKISWWKKIGIKIKCMSFNKKIVTSIGAVALAILITVLWTPLVQRFGGTLSSDSRAYAEEMLRLTREQYNSLSEEMRNKLGESIQNGGLPGVLDEAAQAPDVQVYSDTQAEKIIQEDAKNYMKTVYSEYEDRDAGYAYIPPGERFSGEYKVFLFRFTDTHNRRTHLALFTKKNILLPQDLITASTTISITRFDLRDNIHYPQFSKEVSVDEKLQAQKFMEERLRKNAPLIWKEISQAASVNFFESQENSGQKYSTVIDEFNKKRESSHDSEEVIIADEPLEIMLDTDSDSNPYRHVTYILSYYTKEGIKGWVSMNIDRIFPQNIIDPLEIDYLK